MSRVFVVQQPSFYNRKNSEWEQKYDLSPAERYGNLIVLLPPGNIPLGDLDDVVDTMDGMLQDFGPDDHLLTLGDPVAIAAAVMLASSYCSSVSILKWDRIWGEYTPFPINIET